MPLSFDSISHGRVAFGFFNIESDMLLLERYFFFGGDFCEAVSRFAENSAQGPYEEAWEVYVIPDPREIGDLMGAIRGVRYQGFIGETYLRFPFPLRAEDFRQKTDGYKNRDAFESMIEKYTIASEVLFRVDGRGVRAAIGDYLFTRASFQELLKYVWRGGYPRWEDNVAPDYVVAMKRKVEQHPTGLFEDITFET
jgi:hypothetical protein